MRILILGGTTEASELIEILAGDGRFRPTLSLAGRTTRRPSHEINTRVGGFGGEEGLAEWIASHGVDAVIDATHPFAVRISANARRATLRCGIPLCTVLRPAWQAGPGDLWTEVSDFEASVAALGQTPQRVFLTIGRQTISAFKAAPQHHYLIRSIEMPEAEDLPTNFELVAGDRSIDFARELDFLRSNRVDVIVSKNSGGAAIHGKIEAARCLSIPIIMISRPHKDSGFPAPTSKAAFAWLERIHGASSRSERGV